MVCNSGRYQTTDKNCKKNPESSTKPYTKLQKTNYYRLKSEDNKQTNLKRSKKRCTLIQRKNDGGNN